MARDVIERKLTAAKTGRVSFSVASPDDDVDIRRLLRENPLTGKISLTLEREPNYFAYTNLPGELKQTIVARNGRRVACVGSCTIRRRFVNGKPSRVGYLGGLRLDASQVGRFDILRRGYELFHALQTATPADFYFTSIAADNARARNFLERGLPGLPRYEFIGEFVTVLIPMCRRSRREAARSKSAKCQSRLTLAATAELVAHLNEYNRQHQFAPCWTVEELTALKPLGLDLELFQSVHDGKKITAHAALWDQRHFRQTVIRGYAPWLKLARPALNLFAHFTGGIKLPAIGETLANAFVSHLIAEPGSPDALVELLTMLLAAAAQRKIKMLTLGLAANDPRLIVVQKHFRSREYRSRLYVVRWPDCGGAASELAGNLLAPEVALL